LEELHPDYRLAFLLRVYERLPYTEIARVLGVRTGTAKSRVHRARKRLREALGPYLDESRTGDRDGEPPAGEVTG
jgi:RNA polymerase sigma-70 factor (ECF subfamily)